MRSIVDSNKARALRRDLQGYVGGLRGRPGQSGVLGAGGRRVRVPRTRTGGAGLSRRAHGKGADRLAMSRRLERLLMSSPIRAGLATSAGRAGALAALAGPGLQQVDERSMGEVAAWLDRKGARVLAGLVREHMGAARQIDRQACGLIIG